MLSGCLRGKAIHHHPFFREAAGQRHCPDSLERVREDQPELILLDLMMPEMDGFEFLLELRRVAAWRDIPVVVVSAKDLTEEDRRRLSGDADSILQKGAYTRQELREQVRGMLAHCSTGHGEPGNG